MLYLDTPRILYIPTVKETITFACRRRVYVFVCVWCVRTRVGQLIIIFRYIYICIVVIDNN